MRVVRLLTAALTLAATAVLLSGCLVQGGQGVTVPPGSELLEQCTPELFSVEDLASRGEPGCDLIGSSVRIPDGPIFEVREVGAAFSHQSSATGSVIFQILNWGVPGIAVSAVDGGQLIDLWASSSKAEELQRQQLSLDGVGD